MYLSFLLLFFLSACEQEELIPDDVAQIQSSGIENVQVVNGELHFTNPDTYREDLGKILKMNEIELNEWEKAIGFNSLRSVINEAHEEFGKLTSADQIPAWEERYGDVVEYRDNEVFDRIEWPTYQIIADRSGEYMIGDTYAKALPDKLIMIQNGDRTRLKEAMSLTQSDYDIGILIVDNGTKFKIETRTSCGTSQTHQGVSEHDKRRAYIILHIKEENSGGYSWTQVVLHRYGKKKAFGWHKYKTQHQTQYVNFEAYNNNGILQTLVSDYSSLFLVDVKDVYTYFDFNDFTPSNYYTITPDFEKAKGRTTTRGTDRHWATICCGYSSNCPQTIGDSYFTP